MAKKELTYFDILKKEYSEIEKINQRLKYISKGYYISYGGAIYLESLVDFEEVRIQLRYPEKINELRGVLVLPNEFFEFSKKAKKTKLTIKEDKDDKGKYFLFGQDDSDLSYMCRVTNPESEIDDEYIHNIIKSSMYKRFFNLDQYISYDTTEDDYIMFSSDQIQDLLSPKPVYLTYNDNNFTFTKHMILDLKKGDTLGIRRLCYEVVEQDKKRVFYTMKHETDLYTSHILFNTVQS